METLILAALLLNAHPAKVPACSTRFVKMWQDNRERAWTHMPKRACRYQTDSGSYICQAGKGCIR